MTDITGLIQIATGMMVNPLNPDPETLTIQDIALVWNGQKNIRSYGIGSR